MSAWELPTSLNIGGVAWDIRTDFRVILDILAKFSDPDYSDDEKWWICLDILYEGFSEYLPDGGYKINMPREYHEEAAEKAMHFIDMGIKDSGKQRPSTMDWEQDAPIIIPAVNRVMGIEVRSVPYMHWWTFLGAYMEVGESLFSQVVNIRQKKAKGKKLEKWEREFYKENKAIIDLDTRYTQEEKEEQKRLNELLG